MPWPRRMIDLFPLAPSYNRQRAKKRLREIRALERANDQKERELRLESLRRPAVEDGWEALDRQRAQQAANRSAVASACAAGPGREPGGSGKQETRQTD